MATIKRSFVWQIAQQIVRGCVGIFVTVSVARSLGDTGLGTLDSSVALVNMAGGIASLGMSRIVTRDLCRSSEVHSEVRGTSLTLAGLACFVGFLVVNGIGWNSSNTERLVLLASSLVLLSQPFAYLANSMFEAAGRLDVVAKVLGAGLLVSTLMKITLIFLGASLSWFALAFSVDMIVTCFGAWILLPRVLLGQNLSLSFNLQKAKTILTESLPLLLAGMAAYVYGSMDILMLKWMIGNAEVGLYGAAARISQIPLFIPGALLGAFTAKFMQHFDLHSVFSDKDLKTVTRLLALLAFATLAGGILLGPFAVNLLYGEEFSKSGTILQIHVIGIFFMIMGSLRNHLLVLEGRGKLIFFADLFGATTNLIANLVLIPSYGAIGASWATAISYCVAFFLINFFHPHLRKYNRILLTLFPASPSLKKS